MALQVSVFCFKAMVQAVILLGLETWVVTPRMVKSMGRFQAQLVRRLAVRIPWRTPYRKWTYTSAETAQEEAGFLKMEEYIRWCQNMIAQYIATRSLSDLCEGSERAPGERHRWELTVIHYPRNMVIYHYPLIRVLSIVICPFFCQKLPNFFLKLLP